MLDAISEGFDAEGFAAAAVPFVSAIECEILRWKGREGKEWDCVLVARRVFLLGYLWSSNIKL